MNKSKYFAGRLTILLICLSSVFYSGNSQNTVSSPYSRFGLGDLYWKGFGQSKAMGGIGIGINDKRHLNMINPASYNSMDSGVDSMSVTFEFGLSDRISKFKTNNYSETANNASFSYLAIGFPVSKKMAASIGVIPYSNVGYDINDIQTFNSIGDVNYNYSGTGGISQFYIGGAVEPVKNLSLGLNFSYLFGSLEQGKSITFPEEVDFLNSSKTDKTIISDVIFDFGLQYSIDFNNDRKLTIGGIYGNKTNLDVRHDMTIINYAGTVKDTISDINNEPNLISLPGNFGLGFTFGEEDKFTFGADYYQQNWENTSFLGKKDSLANSNRISFGMEFVPDYRSLNNYFQRVRYRVGGHISNTYLQLRGNQLNEIGLSLGLSLPLAKTQYNSLSETSINISFEFGKRGTLENNLLKENYAIIGLNLTLQDVWFKKRKWN
ncbi:hypothetical protein ACFLTI_05715 [Bacteroidota bacterium]